MPNRKTRRGRKFSNVNRNNQITKLIGTRSIISMGPTTTYVDPLIDLRLTPIGLSENKILQTKKSNPPTYFLSKVSIYGMCGMTFINYVNVISRSSGVIRNTSPVITITTPFRTAKLMNLKISVSPGSQQRYRSGKVACVFVPIRTATDFTQMMRGYRPMPFSSVEAMAGAITSPSDKSFTFTFKPKPSDGFCYQYNRLPEYFGMLIISYEKTIRTHYRLFDSTEFSPVITLTGKVILQSQQFNSTYSSYVDRTFTYPERPAISSYSIRSNTWLHLNNVGLKFTRLSNQVSISGRRFLEESVKDTETSEDLDDYQLDVDYGLNEE